MCVPHTVMRSPREGHANSGMPPRSHSTSRRACSRWSEGSSRSLSPALPDPTKPWSSSSSPRMLPVPSRPRSSGSSVSQTLKSWLQWLDPLSSWVMRGLLLPVDPPGGSRSTWPVASTNAVAGLGLPPTRTQSGSVPLKRAAKPDPSHSLGCSRSARELWVRTSPGSSLRIQPQMSWAEAEGIARSGRNSRSANTHLVPLRIHPSLPSTEVSLRRGPCACVSVRSPYPEAPHRFRNAGSGCGPRRSDQAAFGRPAGELAPVAELELAEHRADVRLHRLHADEQLLGDLLVGVAAGDQPEHLAFPGGELVELRVALGRRVRRERVQHEPRQPRPEHRVALVHPAHGVGEVIGRDRLRDVAPGSRPDDLDDVLGGIADREGEEPRSVFVGGDLPDDPGAAALRHVHVDQNDVGTGTADSLDRGCDVGRVAGDLELPPELRLHARQEQPVVVDQEHADRLGWRLIAAHWSCLGSRSATSVPSPGSVVTVAVPPARSMRPRMLCEMPRRSSGTVDASNPFPRSRTKALI